MERYRSLTPLPHPLLPDLGDPREMRSGFTARRAPEFSRLMAPVVTTP
jgi:hypothetical protein